MAYHEKRYSPAFPMGIGMAVWGAHRLAGVRRDPAGGGARGGPQCGVVLTKPIDLRAVAASASILVSSELTAANILLNLIAISFITCINGIQPGLLAACPLSG